MFDKSKTKKKQSELDKLIEARQIIIDRISEGVDLDPEELLRDTQAIKELTEAIERESGRKSKGEQLFDDYGKPVIGFIGGIGATLGILSYIMAFEKYDAFGKTGSTVVGKAVTAYAKAAKII